MTNQHLEIAVENAAKDLIDHYLVFELCHNDIAKYAAATNCTVEQAQRKVDLGRKLQEIEKDRVAKEAFDRGYEGASPDMPSKYSASFSDLWEDNWNAGMIKGRLSIARKTAKRNADNALKLAAKYGIKLN